MAQQQQGGSRPSLSDSSVGFMLKVEADASIQNMKEAEQTFDKLDKTVKKTAQSFADSTGSMIENINKLAESGMALKDGVNFNINGDKELVDMLKTITKSGGGMSLHIAELRADKLISGGGEAPGATAPLTAAVAPEGAAGAATAVMAGMSILSMLRTGKLKNSFLNTFKVLSRGILRGAKDKSQVVNPTAGKGSVAPDHTSPLPSQEEFSKMLKKAYEANAQENMGIAGKTKGITGSLLQELEALGTKHGFNTSAPSSISVVKDSTIFHDSVKELEKFIGRLKGSGGKGGGLTPATTGQSADPEEAMEMVMSLLPSLMHEFSKFGAIVSASFTKSGKAAKNFFGLVGHESIVTMGAVVLAAREVVGEFNEFNESMKSLRQQTQATTKELNVMGNTAMDVSLKTGTSIKNASLAMSALRSKGIGPADKSMAELTETSVKLGKIWDMNAGEVGDFVGTLHKGFGMSKSDIESVTAVMMKMQDATGLTSEQAIDNIKAVKDSFRTFRFDTEEAKKKALEAMTALGGALNAVGGDASAASSIMDAMTKRFDEGSIAYTMLSNTIGAGATKNIRSMIKTGDSMEAVEQILKGAERFAAMYGKDSDQYKRFAESIGLSVAQVEDLAKANKELAKAKKAADDSDAQKVINQRYKDTLSTWDELVQQVENFFKVFAAEAGKPIMYIPLKVMQALVAVLQMIPAPLVKIGGLMAGIFLTMKSWSIVKWLTGLMFPYIKSIKKAKEEILETTLATKGLEHETAKLGRIKTGRSGLIEGILGTRNMKIGKMFNKGLKASLEKEGAKGLVKAIFGKEGKKFAGLVLDENIPGFKWLRRKFVARMAGTVGEGGKELGFFAKMFKFLKFEKILAPFSKLIGKVGEFFKVLKPILKIGGEILGVVMIFAELWSVAHKVMKDMKFTSLENLSKTLDKISAGLGFVKDAFSAIFSLDFSKAADLFQNALDTLPAAIEQLPDRIISYLEDLPVAIDKWFEKLGKSGFMDKLFDNLLDSHRINTIALKLVWAVSKAFVKALLKLPEVFTSFVMNMGKMFLHAIFGIGEMIGKGLEETIGDAISSWIDGLTGKIAGWLKKIPIIGDRLSKGFTTSAGLASDALNFKGYTASAEAIKASNTGEALGYSTTNTVSAQGTGTTSDDGTKELLQRMANALDTNNDYQKKMYRQGQDGDSNGNSVTNQYNAFGAKLEGGNPMERKVSNGL